MAPNWANSMEAPNSSPTAAKNKTPPKSKALLPGKKVTERETLLNKTSRAAGAFDDSGKRPPGKTPLAALLSKNQVKPGDANLMLVTVTVLGSPGPLRFLVDRADTVSRVVDTALRVYAREGRLPLLNNKLVELFCDNGDFKALEPSESVGSLGTRQFLLYRKKPEDLQGQQQQPTVQPISHPFKHWWSFMSALVCSH